MCALNTIFSQNSGDRILQRSDFHVPKDKKIEELDILNLYIEAIFAFDEVLADNCENTNAIPMFYQSMVVDSPEGIPLLRVRLVATWERSSNLEGSIDSHIYYITCTEEEKIDERNMHPANRKELDFIRVIYVPAVRDPSKQLKNVSGTMMHQILSTVNWDETTQNRIRDTIGVLNNSFASEKGVDILNKSIHSQWKNYDSDNRYSDAVLRFNSTDIESAIKNSEVYFSPTVTEKEYTIDEMGDGLRSLFYISMVNSILDVEATIAEEIDKNIENKAFSQVPPVLTIVAIEEPENHISPQLLGKLIANLKCISEKNNAQVMLTSHSPAIVKRIEPEDIRYLRIDISKMNTVVRKIILPDKESLENQYKYIKEAVRAYPEIYFSKIVVLGEGDSEEIILPKFLEVYGKNLDADGISIVPLGGRYVNHFWRLLSELKIPYVTLLDLDRERKGGGWGRIKYALQQLLLIGAPREKLLQLSDGVFLSDEELSLMHTRAVDQIQDMDIWIRKLEDYNVYYSYPLDIDFMMLETIGEKYKDSLDENEGPMLSVKDEQETNRKIAIKEIDKDKYSKEYKERMELDVRHTLKKEGGNGITYNETQKEWMIWYNYFFLNRGKPATHIAILSAMSDDELLENTPEVIKRLIDKVNEENKDNYEER